MPICIKGGHLYTPEDQGIQDLLIDDNRLIAIGHDLAAGADQVIDATHQLIIPGLVDVHVHYRDPGETAKETIATGSAASAAGGFTQVIAMANTHPVPDTRDRFMAQQTRNAAAVIAVHQFAPITMNREGTELVDQAALAQLGARGFSNDGSGINDTATMYRAMQQAAALRLPIVAHAEDLSLVQGKVVLNELAAARIRLTGVPAVAETAQVARDLALAAATGVHYHVCHVSNAQTVALIREAKARGVNVTCEVTPHHLLLSAEAVGAATPNLKMNPPLQPARDRDALVAGLLDGTIDMIATDHAPHTAADKARGMVGAPCGIVGSETAWPVLYTHLVVSGRMTVSTLLRRMSLAPAKAFQLRQPILAPGQPADLVIVDPVTTCPVDPTQFKSQGHNSPFAGWPLQGWPVRTMVGGHWVD